MALDMLREGKRSQAEVARIMKVSAPSRLVERAGEAGAVVLDEAAD